MRIDEYLYTVKNQKLFHSKTLFCFCHLKTIRAVNNGFLDNPLPVQYLQQV